MWVKPLPFHVPTISCVMCWWVNWQICLFKNNKIHYEWRCFSQGDLFQSFPASHLVISSMACWNIRQWGSWVFPLKPPLIGFSNTFSSPGLITRGVSCMGSCCFYVSGISSCQWRCQSTVMARNTSYKAVKTHLWNDNLIYNHSYIIS